MSGAKQKKVRRLNREVKTAYLLGVPLERTSRWYPGDNWQLAPRTKLDLQNFRYRIKP
jgi:hypothetical protein